MGEKQKWKLSETIMKTLVNESTIDNDLPTYPVCIDSDSFRTSIDTLLLRALLEGMKHFQDVKMCQGQIVKGVVNGVEIAGKDDSIFYIKEKMMPAKLISPEFFPDFMSQDSSCPLLLSPHHRAETAKDNYPVQYGTKIVADKNKCTSF
jgi:hypothetical protein